MGKHDYTMKSYNGVSWDVLYPRTCGGQVTLDDYTKPAGAAAVVAADTVNAAIGKLERGLDTKQNTLGYTAENAAKKGAANGYAGLDASGKVPLSQIPQSASGALAYQGDWDASSGAHPMNPQSGHFWIVSRGGVVSGVDYNVGDWAVYHETKGWSKIDNTDAVASVNGMTGVVELDGDNLKMDGYTKPTTGGAVAATDTVNGAVGKLEKALDGKQAAGSYVSANGGIAAGTKTKITFDAKGLVTSGADADGRDIKMTGYAKAATAADVAASDTVATAIGKVEKKVDDKLTANVGITSGTKTKITYDGKGLVTKGEDASATDIKLAAGYTKAAAQSAVVAGDTLQNAIGKVEKKVDDRPNVYVQAAQPASAAVGDFWFEITG